VGHWLMKESACVVVSSYSIHWPCVLPQHGAGRKHLRPIVLTDWQRALLQDHRQPFLRGLIHSDGCRYIARQRCGGRLYEWPRYNFSNLSSEIRGLFTESCDALGIPWRQAGERHIYINRREGVAAFDEFVGPKY